MEDVNQDAKADMSASEGSSGGSRGLKAVLVIVVLAMLARAPSAFQRYSEDKAKLDRQQQVRQDALRQQLVEIEAAARDGNTGSAIQRLYGVEPAARSASTQDTGRQGEPKESLVEDSPSQKPAERPTTAKSGTADQKKTGKAIQRLFGS